MFSSTHFRSSSWKTNKQLILTPNHGLITAQLAPPSLTTLLALAEPLVSFFIPLIFIPSADTNICFQTEASSDSEETKEELSTQTGSEGGKVSDQKPRSSWVPSPLPHSPHPAEG